MKFHRFLTHASLGGMGAPSFRAHQVTARILDGDWRKLSAPDLELAAKLTERTRFPDVPITRLWLGPARRSGKTRFSAARACYRLAQDYRAKLAPGEVAVVACVAPTTEQASTLFNYARGMVRASPVLAQALVRETASELEFEHRTMLKVYAGSFRSTRGTTYASVIIDEASFLRSEDSALPDVELIRAVLPGLLTLDGDLIVTSSPYMRRGAMYDAYRKFYGNDAADEVYLGGESLLWNPTLNAEAIAKAYADDPEAAASEYGGRHRADLSAALLPEWIDAAICSGVFEREAA